MQWACEPQKKVSCIHLYVSVHVRPSFSQFFSCISNSDAHMVNRSVDAIFKIQVYLSKLFYVLQNVLTLSLASNHPINTMNERTEQTNKKTKKQRRMRRRRKNICERALTCIHNYTHTYTNRRRRRRLCQLNGSWTGSKASRFGCCCCWLVCLPSLQIFKCVLATFSFCV